MQTVRWGILGTGKISRAFAAALKDTPGAVLGAVASRTVDTPFIGNGYAHEAIEAQRCFLAGLIESPGMTHDETLALMGVMDTIREQIGLAYAADLV